jgi:hypothetical protein
MSEIVRATPVRGGRALTVSTVKLGFRAYSTVIFDDTPDHELAGRSVGGWVIDTTEVRSETREAAMDEHRDALYAARVEPLTDANQPAA